MEFILRRAADILNNGGNLVMEINNSCDFYSSDYANHEFIVSSQDFYIFKIDTITYCYVYGIGIYEM